MNVAELVEALKKMPPDAELIVEGCDCEGELDAVIRSPWANKNSVLLARELGDGYLRYQWEEEATDG